jgi:DNA-binding NarL/FixJ family response regulator
VRLRRTLEEEVRERMADLAQRAMQMDNGSAVEEESTSSPTIDELLGRVMELKITRKVLDEVIRIQPADNRPVDPFTPREVEVLTLIAKGFSNKEIARHLNIALSTAKFHVSSILSKLHLSDRTRAALWAVDQGLVPPEESSTRTTD